MATAKTESEDVVRALKLGANDYVTKPLDFPVVLARVNTQLRLKRATDQLTAAHTRMKRDLDAAARVQQSLLPRQLPEAAAATFAWTYRPCDELAGDSLGVHAIDDRLVGIYVLDVSGHGVPAALVSFTATRSLLQQQDERADDVAGLVTNLNALYPMEENGDHYFTMLYGVLETGSGRFRFVNAGHPGPVWLHQDGSLEGLDVPGMPVGVDDEPEYEESMIDLQAGDRLYIYSDGLEEEVNAGGEDFGRERLHAAILEAQTLPLQESVDLLVAKVVAWHGDEHLKDDVSIVAVQMR
jgi:phosphoserine phosphatase RsbU/P